LVGVQYHCWVKPRLCFPTPEPGQKGGVKVALPS
jgi:hypothetical protein